MDIHSAEYIGSYPRVSACPKDDKPEYAFIGRSNVGKSSLLNMLTGRKALAHTSKKPGKTQMINYFLIEENWYMVDLPGYGYARISKKKRQDWRQMVEGYLHQRLQMQCAFVLIDSNIKPQQIDLDFIDELGNAHVPFSIVYTKLDKKRSDHQKNIEAFQKAMLENWEELPAQFHSSAISGEGKEEILQYIEEINERVKQL